MTHLGIVAALPEEARALTDRTVETGKVIELENHTLLCISGIGAHRARAAGQLLVSSGAQALLSWGTAAALSSELSPGSLLLPSKVIAADLSTVAVSRDWHETLHRHLHTRCSVCTRPIAEAEKILYTASEKQALLERSATVAADMESAALGMFAHASGVPFAVLRVIADSADMRLPAWLPQSLDEAGGVRIGTLLFNLLKHPADWPSFIRLTHGFRAANATLLAVSRYPEVLNLSVTGTATGV